MSVIPGNLFAVGIVKSPGHGVTGPKAPGTPDVGKGSVALSDGQTPGKSPAGQEFLPVIPKILGDTVGSSVDISA